MEAEEICLSGADHKLYYSVGFSLINVIKSLASFEPADLAFAIECCKNTTIIAGLLRKKDHGALEKMGQLVKGSTSVGKLLIHFDRSSHYESGVEVEI